MVYNSKNCGKNIFYTQAQTKVIIRGVEKTRFQGNQLLFHFLIIYVEKEGMPNFDLELLCTGLLSIIFL